MKYLITKLPLALLMLITIALAFHSCKKEPDDSTPTTSTPGQVMFWTASDLGCGNITVTCEGNSKTITNFFSNGAPSCGSTGCATFDLNPGTYAYTANCSGLTWSGNITVSENGCSKVELTASGGNGGGGGGSTTGQGMFWTASDLGCGNTTVTCNGISRTITGYYSSGAPSCGASATATFDLTPGTYSYTASCSSLTWNGTITIAAGTCSKVQLTGSGGGGGGSTTGQGTFWTATDFGCGSITVTCNGISRTITSFYSSGTPGCGANGCANFSLSPGTYSYSASCSNRTWNGTITITSNGCARIQFI